MEPAFRDTRDKRQRTLKEVQAITGDTAGGLKACRDRFMRFLEDREYRPLWHALAVLFIIAAASLLFYKNFGFHGTMMYTDMTWPSQLSHLQFNAANTWMPYGSYPIGGSQLWFYWIYPTTTVARLFQISAATYQLLMFIGTFSLAGISMYALAYSTIRSLKLPDTAGYAPYVGAVLAALVFMYNPWSLMYLREYFGYPVYALSPLLFLAMVKTFDSPRLRNIVLFSLFVVVINTSHHLIWFWALFISYLLFFVITNRFQRQKVAGALKVLAGTVAFYLLLGAAWVMPYLGSQLANKPLLPYYSPAFSQGSIQALSANNTIMNNFRLVSFGSWTLTTVRSGVLLETLVFALPVLAVLSFLVMRKYVKGNRVVNYWALVAVLALLLATGSSFILKRYFLYFTLRAPGSGFYGWMLRATERWLFFVPIFFGLMIGILVTRLLVKKPKYLGGASQQEHIDWKKKFFGTHDHAWGLVAAVMMVILILVSLVPVTLWFARIIFSPADVPRDYQKVNDFLASQPDGDRVAWIPFFPLDAYVYKWAPEKKVGPYSVLSSPPSLSSIQAVTDKGSYYNWLESLYLKGSIQPVQVLRPELVLKNDDMSRLFAPFATRYLVFDKSVKGYDFGDNFEAENSIKLVYGTKYLRVYRTDYDPGYISVATTTTRANSFFDNLAVVQKLTKEQSAGLAFSNGTSYFGGSSNIPEKYGVVDINRYLIPITVNGSFEQAETNGPHPGWYLTYDNGKTKVSITDDTKADGIRSLKVVNKSTTRFDIAWISTWEEQVIQGDIYTFETSVKYRNANWSVARIEGYQAKTGQWVPLMACPGIQSSDSVWKKYRCSLLVPGGITKIRPALGAGWVHNSSRGPAVTWFDGVKLSKVNNDFVVALAQKKAAPRIEYTRVNAEKYRVRVRGAAAPFILVLGETYDGLWLAETGDGKKIESVPMYSTINGFPIDKTGTFEVTVRYRLQPWLSAGLAISLLTILVFVIYLMYVYRKRLATAANIVWKPTTRLGRRARESI